MVSNRPLYGGIFLLVVTSFSSSCAHLCRIPIEDKARYHDMTELQQYASKDGVFVFDGQKLHKNAFPKKGKPTAAHAALLAGKMESELAGSDAAVILERMARVKTGFTNRVRHIVTNQWVDKAKALGLKSSITGLPVTNWSDVKQALGANATMESFQMCFALCYKDSESGASAKSEGETSLMKELKLQYHDNTMAGGCLGPVRVNAVSGLIESLQAKSKLRHGLHLVKSNPGSDLSTKGKRRVNGDYYVIESDKSGKMVTRTPFNVRPLHGSKLFVLHFQFCLTSCLPSQLFPGFLTILTQVPRHRKQWTASE